jgi:hypothetical protein
MRASRTLSIYSIFLLYIATFAAAWPLNWPRWLPELDSLIVRQDNSNNTASATGSPIISNTAGPITDAKASATGGGGTTFYGSGASPTPTAAGSENKSNNMTTATKKYTTSYDARLPAGGVSMMTPAVASGEQYFKIGDYVTFGWNYTSLEATPTAVNVLATCTANTQLYTIATNLTLANNTNAVTWDTGSYQATAVQEPLLTETYTLIIYDAGSSISATAQAGYLAVYDSYTFGMYVPQPYTPLADFQCATCSGALSDMHRRALGLVLGMGLLTVLSFTWFVGGTGVIW